MTVYVEESDGRRRTVSADMGDDDIVEVMPGADGWDDNWWMGAILYLSRFYIYH